MSTYRIREQDELFVVERMHAKDEYQFSDQSVTIDEYWSRLAVFPSRDLAEGFRLAHQRGLSYQEEMFLAQVFTTNQCTMYPPNLEDLMMGSKGDWKLNTEGVLIARAVHWCCANPSLSLPNEEECPMKIPLITAHKVLGDIAEIFLNAQDTDREVPIDQITYIVRDSLQEASQREKNKETLNEKIERFTLSPSAPDHREYQDKEATQDDDTSKERNHP